MPTSVQLNYLKLKCSADKIISTKIILYFFYNDLNIVLYLYAIITFKLRNNTILIAVY